MNARAARVVTAAIAVCIATGAPAAHAQPSRVAVAASEATPASARAWAPPLDRRVTLRLNDVTLRDALDRLAAAARLRLSYSAELLPLDRSVRGAFDAAAAGDVLVSLLAGAAVEPVALGDDQVVLAPVRRAGEAPLEPPAARMPQTLERVVVTERADDEPLGPIGVAADVVRPHDVIANSAGTLARSLDGSVPGIWVWEQAPASVLAQYGSIRGASSFGPAAPKLYIDGVQVANPLLVTRFPPEDIERIEVIRGPQGAALYGADAIDGVINIVTRHEGVDDGAPRAELRSELGASRSDFTPGGGSGGVLTQEHVLALRAGNDLRSSGATITFGSLGDVYPGAGSWHAGVTGGFRTIGERSTVTGTLRVAGEQVGTSPSPVLDAAFPREGAAPSSGAAAGSRRMSTSQSLWQYTLGTSAQIASSDRVTHTLVAGIDGYRLGGAIPAGSTVPVLSPADSALLAAHGAADRVTLRASTVGRFGSRERTALSLRATAEQMLLRQATTPAMAQLSTLSVADWFGSTGLALSADVALRGTLYLTGGARLERNEGTGLAAQHALQPMLGGAFVRHPFGTTLRLRAAYGKATRPARAVGRGGAWPAYAARAAADLAPEEQSGYEAGIDFAAGRALVLRVTRFDQRATGLLQRAGAFDDSLRLGTAMLLGVPELQNAGAIANRGWELQGSSVRGPLTLSGTLSLVDSRVERVAERAAGELFPGDRVLGVPAGTVSFGAAWTRLHWSAGFAGTRAFDWINYDRVALARALATPVTSGGVSLRDFRRRYDGVTHLRATASRTLGHGFTGTLTVDNLLDRQTGEPDDVTILPGRTISAALRVAF